MPRESFSQQFISGVQRGQQVKQNRERSERDEEDREFQRKILKFQTDRLKLESEKAKRDAAIGQIGFQEQQPARRMTPEQEDVGPLNAPEGAPDIVQQIMNEFSPRLTLDTARPHDPVRVPGVAGQPDTSVVPRTAEQRIRDENLARVTSEQQERNAAALRASAIKKAEFEATAQDVGDGIKVPPSSVPGVLNALRPKAPAAGRAMNENEAIRIMSSSSSTEQERTDAQSFLTMLDSRKKDVEDAAVDLDIAIDPESKNILAQTGMSLGAFAVLTGQITKLAGRSTSERRILRREAEQWSRDHNVDPSAIVSQYEAYNEVLNSNVKRLSFTQIMEDELEGTLDNMDTVSATGNLGDLRVKNVAQLFATGEINDPITQQYRFHLFQLRNELAAYGAATQGRSGAQIDVADQKEAEEVIKDGVAKGGLIGLRKGVEDSTVKMGEVMERSVVNARRRIWGLFGVGDNFDAANAPAETQTGTVTMQDKDGNVWDIAPENVEEAKKLGAVEVDQ